MSNKNEAADKLIDRMVFKAGCGELIEVQIGDIKFYARCDYLSYGGDELTEPARIEMKLSTYMKGVKFVAAPDDQKDKEIRKLRERLGKVGAAKAGLEDGLGCAKNELQIALQALECKQFDRDHAVAEAKAKYTARIDALESKVESLDEQLECERLKSDNLKHERNAFMDCYADLAAHMARLRHEQPNQFVGSVSSIKKHWYEIASVMWTLGLLFGAISGVVATVICLG